MADLVRDERFQLGLEAYREGRHYEAHELWEEIWIDDLDDLRRSLLAALIQIASAIHKVQNDVGRPGSVVLLGRALEKLETVPDEFEGIDVAELRESVERCRSEIERVIDAEEDVLDPRMIPAIGET